MDEDACYAVQVQYHKWLEEVGHTAPGDVVAVGEIPHSVGSVLKVDASSVTVAIQPFEPPKALDSAVANVQVFPLLNHSTCGFCGSDDIHEVFFDVGGVETYKCNDCLRVSGTFTDEPRGTVSGDLPEAEEVAVGVNYNILDNTFPVGVATDKGYHHHISIPHLGFETVKENVKNWAVETGYTLEVKD